MSASAKHVAAGPQDDPGLFRVVFGSRDSSGEELHSDVLLETALLEEAMDCFTAAKFDLPVFWSTSKHVNGDERMARVVFFARLERGGMTIGEATYGRNEYVRPHGIRQARAIGMVRP